jgi:hypothetical protein
MDVTPKAGRKAYLPSDAEDAKINAGIATDPDAREITDEGGYTHPLCWTSEGRNNQRTHQYSTIARSDRLFSRDGERLANTHRPSIKRLCAGQ